MLVAKHESLVTQVEKLLNVEHQSDDDKNDRLSDLLYGEPPRTLMCPQSWRGSLASLQLSQSPYSCPSFAMPLQCLRDVPLWRPTVAGASQTSTELRSLPQSSPVFSGVLQSLAELLLVRRSSCYFLGAPFPRSSLEILREASPVF